MVCKIFQLLVIFLVIFWWAVVEVIHFSVQPVVKAHWINKMAHNDIKPFAYLVLELAFLLLCANFWISTKSRKENLIGFGQVLATRTLSISIPPLYTHFKIRWLAPLRSSDQRRVFWPFFSSQLVLSTKQIRCFQHNELHGTHGKKRGFSKIKIINLQKLDQWLWATFTNKGKNLFFK